MQLINQHTKKIMEECKIRARDAGLSFSNETLEYIVTNRDMLELSPKGMIPTMYDYWVNDVQVHKKKGVYKLYPNNPYETVINSRPPISFYNDNNPDWLNIMIFYHVIAHIDFFQNNIFFKHTWNDDFVGKALADKRLIQNLRDEHGRWVDYILEFSRAIDNLTGYFKSIAKFRDTQDNTPTQIIDYYFKIFLQEIVKVPEHVIYNEIQRYNALIEKDPNIAESLFLAEVRRKHPEFQTKFTNYSPKEQKKYDVLEYLLENSQFLNKENNKWMKTILNIVRETSLYFAPQIRTKTVNEGWASYWHEKLFIQDKRIQGHESAFAKINAGVTSISRIGLNPYAIGLRLFKHIEDYSNKGKFTYDFQKIFNSEQRKIYNTNNNAGQESIFQVREQFCDNTFFTTFVNQDFTDRYNLFTVGERLNQQQGVKEYYIKSKKAEDYKKMLLNSLYHPPYITVNTEKTSERNLYLQHHFEGKQLYKEFIPDTLMGIEFLWGNQVQIETTEIVKKKIQRPNQPLKFEHKKVIYTSNNKEVKKYYIP